MTEDLGDLNASSSGNAVMYSTENQTFEQIIKHYLNDVKRILDEMKTLMNQTDRRALTNATTTEKTVIAPDLSTLLDNKISIVNKLTALVKNSRLKDFAHFQKEAFWSIPVMMQEECNSLQRVVESLQKQKEENDEILTKLKKFEQFHDEVNSTDVSPNSTLELLDKINAEVSRDFKQCKNDFVAVLNTVFPNSNFEKVMFIIMEKSKNSNGEWFDLDIDQQHHEVIEYLLEAGLLICNPNDWHQFKFIT